MKKVACGIMLMLLINMSMLAFCTNLAEADANTIYVNADNKAGPWDGTRAYPYKNITMALQHALAGNTIYVSKGAYYENLVINETVSLVGENKETTIIDGRRIGTAVEIAADNVLISGFTINGSGQEWPDSGLQLTKARNCKISGNDIANNFDGIKLFDSSSNNSISENSITNNLGGISLYYSSNNSIHGNSITGNNGFGIFLHFSSNNSIRENDIVNNRWGIELDFDSNYNRISGNDIRANSVDGIGFDHSMNNAVFRNNIAANNECGVRISGTSEYNLISGNGIMSNLDAIRLSGSSTNNTIFHNNFVDNQRHASTDNSYGNQWDDGYPSGGNYWSDYQEKYSNASQIDSSGIWNTPYVIDSGNIDHYPLMNKYATEEDFFAFRFDCLIVLSVLFSLMFLTYFIIKRRRSRKKVGGSVSEKLSPAYYEHGFAFLCFKKK
jgi:parallel beta-helix repeat protein